MRRMLPALILTLALILVLPACSDVTSAVSPEGPSFARGRGGAPGEVTIQSLAASISGPSSIGTGQTCDYTGSASGGTAPYTYTFLPSYTGSNSYFVGGTGPSNVFHGTGYYFGSGTSTTVWLSLEVTDALGAKASTIKYMTLYNSAVGCV